jgi:hypothetical protein
VVAKALVDMGAADFDAGELFEVGDRWAERFMSATLPSILPLVAEAPDEPRAQEFERAPCAFELIRVSIAPGYDGGVLCTRR